MSKQFIVTVIINTVGSPDVAEVKSWINTAIDRAEYPNRQLIGVEVRENGGDWIGSGPTRVSDLDDDTPAGCHRSL